MDRTDCDSGGGGGQGGGHGGDHGGDQAEVLVNTGPAVAHPGQLGQLAPLLVVGGILLERERLDINSFVEIMHKLNVMLNFENHDRWVTEVEHIQIESLSMVFNFLIREI